MEVAIASNMGAGSAGGLDCSASDFAFQHNHPQSISFGCVEMPSPLTCKTVAIKVAFCETTSERWSGPRRRRTEVRDMVHGTASNNDSNTIFGSSWMMTLMTEIEQARMDVQGT
jgi:hypothetical protein